MKRSGGNSKRAKRRVKNQIVVWRERDRIKHPQKLKSSGGKSREFLENELWE
jgi:hypothetical protein